MTRPPQGTGLIAASVCVHDDHPSAASYSGQSDSLASCSQMFVGEFLRPTLASFTADPAASHRPSVALPLTKQLSHSALMHFRHKKALERRALHVHPVPPDSHPIGPPPALSRRRLHLMADCILCGRLAGALRGTARQSRFCRAQTVIVDCRCVVAGRPACRSGSREGCGGPLQGCRAAGCRLRCPLTPLPPP